MSDEQEPEAVSGSLTPEQAIRLKHQLQQGITWGGLNARQIEALTQLQRSDWQTVRSDYDRWVGGMRVLSENALFVLVIMSAVAWWYFRDWPAQPFLGISYLVGLTAMMLTLVGAITVFRRAGHREGYMDGYENGLEGGVYRVLGVSDDDVTEIHDTAIEMDCDDRALKAVEKRQAGSNERP